MIEFAMGSSPAAPSWIVLPLALIVMIVIAGHIIALRETPKGKIPESRRRIRIATGWVMLITVPLTAYGFGIATTDEPRVYTLVWTSVVGLLCGVLMLAMVDILNTLRIHRIQRAEVEKEIGGRLGSAGYQRRADVLGQIGEEDV